MSRVWLLVILAAACIRETKCVGDGWVWGPPAKWPKTCEQNKNPSPVDISGSDVDEVKVVPLEFMGLELEYRDINCEANHNGTIIKCDLKSEIKPYVLGGGIVERLGYEYYEKLYLQSFHIHWQSEHSMMGKRYPLEMHLVLHSKRVRNIKEALTYKELVIIAILLDKAPMKDPGQNLHKISMLRGCSTLTARLNEVIFVPTDVLSTFYVYKGSLTHPPCTEEATWIVFLTPIMVANIGAPIPNTTLPAKPQPKQLTKYVGTVKVGKYDYESKSTGEVLQPMIIWICVLSCVVVIQILINTRYY